MSVVERYLALALELGKHAEELIDSYHGPVTVPEEPRSPAELVREAAALLEEVDDRWLAAQVGSLHATARRLAGERLPYAEEVELVYGITPEWRDEAVFEDAQRRLDEALPGTGDLRDRYADWLAVAIPPERVGDAVRATAALLRERVRNTIGLPDGEAIDVEVVTDKPWRGFARYQSNFRTHISVNVDLPFEAGILSHFVAHECYPGHHTHRSWIEAVCIRDRGETEKTLDLLWSPEAVINEGIAELAVPFAVDLELERQVAGLLADLGVDYDPDVAAAVQSARHDLGWVPGNVAILLRGRGASRAEAVDYVRRWGLQPDERIERMVTITETEDSPGYVHTYSQGLELVQRWTQLDAERLRELMTGRFVPADLV